MKDLIKNILLEQTGVVPPDSWPGEAYIGHTVDGSSWAKQSITKVMFFKAVKLLVKHNSWDEIVEFTDGNQNLWERANDLDKYTRLVGVAQNSEGLSSKILWAAHDNYNDVESNSITSYGQLTLRPLNSYKVKMFEDIREFKTVDYEFDVEDFDVLDAENRVMYDDDGEYHHYDYDPTDTEYHESETQEHAVDGTPTLIGVVWSHDMEDDVEGEPVGPELSESTKAVQKDGGTIDKLEDILDTWETKQYPSDKARWEEYYNDIKKVVKKHKSKPLTEQLLKEQTLSSEAEQAAISNQQHITIVEAKFMANIKKRFDSSTIAKLVEMTHYDLSDNQELTQIARAFGVYESGRFSNALRLTQLINLIWDNMDLDEFSSFVGELAPKLQYIEITQEYVEVTEGRYVASTGSWGVDYENTACQLKNDFWNYDPDLEHLHDDSHDFVQGSERWVNITIDGNNVWDDGIMGETKNVDNEYDIENLPC